VPEQPRPIAGDAGAAAQPASHRDGGTPDPEQDGAEGRLLQLPVAGAVKVVRPLVAKITCAPPPPMGGQRSRRGPMCPDVLAVPSGIRRKARYRCLR